MRKKRKSLFKHKKVEPEIARYDVKDNHIVTIDYTMVDDEGNFLDTTEGNGPLSYLQGSSQIPRPMQTALEGQPPGGHVTGRIAAINAYGDYDPSQVQMLERPLFAVDDLSEGMQYELITEEGLRVVTILNVEGNVVKVDLNHPLAGRNISFDVTVISVHPATSEELEKNQIH
jgi:FKBP-type peptidyl-prolyl cis-trans isomerase SlyD